MTRSVVTKRRLWKCSSFALREYQIAAEASPRDAGQKRTGMRTFAQGLWSTQRRCNQQGDRGYSGPSTRVRQTFHLLKLSRLPGLLLPSLDPPTPSFPRIEASSMSVPKKQPRARLTSTQVSEALEGSGRSSAKRYFQCEKRARGASSIEYRVSSQEAAGYGV